MQTVKVIRVEKINTDLGTIEMFDFKDEEKANAFVDECKKLGYSTETYNFEASAQEYNEILESLIANKPTLMF